MNLPSKRNLFFGILGLFVAISVLWWLKGVFSGKRSGKSLLISDMLLPTTVHPVHYDLTMKVFLPGYESNFPAEKNLTFDAKLVIRLVVDKPVETVTVNSKYINFTKHKCRFTTEEGTSIKIVNIETNQLLEQTTFRLERAVDAGEHVITIVYSGSINDHLNGLYRTSYSTPEGVQKIAAVTKMEPYFARKMVPCFDEPSYKATWNVTVIHPKGTTAVSNSIEIGNPEEEADFLVTRFKKTPPMSSYLLAVFVSDFTFIEEHSQSGVRFRVWTRPEAQKSAEYALEAGIKCLDGYEKLFGIDFPLEKQDFLGLPDFSSGAMENWGLITYREYLLLFDQRNYYYQNKVRVTSVIAHELAHQWFGNLVTVKWWDDLWLQEGFASFVEAIGSDIIADGEFRMEEEFVSDQLRQSLELDSMASSHPIIFPTATMDDITDLFDPISYRKGASVLAMIRNLLGKETFIRGVQNYLKKYAYGNADHRDLFHEWDQVVPEELKGSDGKRLNITEFALRWTKQMGYPLLTATSINSTHLAVKQERFKVDPAAKERPKFATSPYEYKWNVPLWVQNGTDPEVEVHWIPAEGEVILEKDDGPMVVNADSYAVARMNYEPDGWQKIFEQLETDHSVYSPRTKYRIIADAFAVAAVDKISYDDAFKVSNYLINEREYLPWLAYITEMRSLFDLFGNLPQREHLKNMVKRLIEPRFNEIDIRYTTRSMENNKAYMAGRLDVLLWVEYCKVSPKSCASTVRLYFNGALGACRDESAILSKCARVHPALRTYIYNEAVRTGGEDVFRKMLNFYKRETLQLEKERILLAMSSTTDPRLLTSLMSNLSSPNSEIFRLQDCPMSSVYLAQNKDACPLLLSYLIDHWEELRQKFIENHVMMNKIISSFTCGVETEESLAKLKIFVKSSDTAGNYYMFTQQIQKSERRIDWLKKNANDLEKILDSMFV